MRLGTDTGSFVNHLRSRAVIGQPEARVGMGATLLGWTDRHAATVASIEKVGTRLIVGVRQDHARRTDSNGFSESQDYEFTPDAHGFLRHFRANRAGLWEEVAFNEATRRWSAAGGYRLRLGAREEYHDFAF